MRLLLCFFLAFVAHPLFAEDSFLKPNDVIALVGGEDMVVASELGYLETLVQQALPKHQLKFRGLAWEGDTVFEQRRDLNYPPLEAQLDKIGATVVVAQFGQMESLGGEAKLRAFEEAAQAFLARLRGASKRRLVLIALIPLERRGDGEKYDPKVMFAYGWAVKGLQSSEDVEVDPFAQFQQFFSGTGRPKEAFETRDGLHLREKSHASLAWSVAATLLNSDERLPTVSAMMARRDALDTAIIQKNRLWFHYSRPQNWAFLAGDRTNQPSSRDHKDLSKRWFPAELEQFVPLIEAKEKEIWELAAKLKH